MKEKVRLVAGDSAGDVIEWDRSKAGPVIRIPKMPDFPAHIGPADPPDIAETFKTDDYRIQQINYESGHRHLFAAPDNMRTVDIMNVLWHSYQDSQK